MIKLNENMKDDFLKLLLEQNEKRLCELEKKVDALSKKVFFYIGFFSALSFALNKFFL